MPVAERVFRYNTAKGEYAAVLGGMHNRATGMSSIAAGTYNTASGATSLALGNVAVASDAFSITVGTSSNNTPCKSNGVNTLSLCAASGVYINGVRYVAGGSDPTVAALQAAVAANTLKIAANTAAIEALPGGGTDAATIADLTDQVNVLRAGLIVVSILTVGQLAGLVYVCACVHACVRACVRASCVRACVHRLFLLLLSAASRSTWIRGFVMLLPPLLVTNCCVVQPRYMYSHRAQVRLRAAAHRCAQERQFIFVRLRRKRRLD
jgi:hypothetical protein